MNATTNISKEEFLNKVESAIKALDDVPHYDRRHLIDDVLLDKIFELAYNSIYNSIPIEWIKKEIETYIREDRMDDYEYYYTDTLKLMLKRWEKENENN